MLEQIAAYLGQENVEFGFACVGTAMVVIGPDWFLLFVKNRSVLGLSYADNPIMVFIGWSVAAGVVGLLAGLFEVVQHTPQGALAVSVGWPALFSRIVEVSGGGAPVQTTTEEVADG